MEEEIKVDMTLFFRNAHVSHKLLGISLSHAAETFEHWRLGLPGIVSNNSPKDFAACKLEDVVFIFIEAKEVPDQEEVGRVLSAIATG